MPFWINCKFEGLLLEHICWCILYILFFIFSIKTIKEDIIQFLDHPVSISLQQKWRYTSEVRTLTIYNFSSMQLSFRFCNASRIESSSWLEHFKQISLWAIRYTIWIELYSMQLTSILLASCTTPKTTQQYYKDPT